jgi:serine/threonine protein kinase
MDTDRNLLFGVLALQADLLDSARFAEVCSAWATHKDTPLADLLVARGWLTPNDRADVEKLLDRKLKKHGGDAHAGLAEVTNDHVRQSLAAVTDADVRQSLAGPTPPPRGHILVSTTAHVPEARERYTLSRLHATGGIGRVWLARDDSLGRDVALKELRPERAAQPAVWGRFLREARITGQLEHPGIVPIYEVSRRPDEQAPFYTMRFVRGRTLAEAAAGYHHKRGRGEAGPLELRELLTAFVGVCQAVAYAHSRGVLHRDLKPQNVVLGDYGEVIVLDWGLARILGQSDADADTALPPVAVEGGVDGTVQGQVLGTPAYMAPEQAEGRLDQLGPATDVYGLGAILYEVLTGRPPFTGADTTAVLRQVVHEQPDPPRSVVAATPVALEAVCLKALAKKSAARYSSAKELAGEVQQWLAGEPVAAYPEPWPTRLARWGRRHRPLVVGATALMMTAVVALAVGLVAVDRERQRTAEEKERTAAALSAESKARQQARQALDEMSSQVIENWLARQQSKLEPAQQEFLNKALAFYQDFAAESGDREEVRRGVADAHRRIGAIRHKLGQHQAAEQAYRRAIDLYQQLVADIPAQPRHRRDLAGTGNNLGVLLRDTGRPKEAEVQYRHALALRQQLADDFPDEPRYREDLAVSNTTLGNVLIELGRLKEAETYLRACVTRYQQLVDASPKVPAYREGLALGQSNLGGLLTRLGRKEEAEAAHRAAVAVDKQLADEFPAETKYRRGLARSQTHLGNLLRDTGQPAEAETAFRDALAVRRQLAADFPTLPQHRQDLAATKRSRFLTVLVY